MRFNDDANLKVTLPKWSHIDAREILQKKRQWLEKTLHRLVNSRKVLDEKKLLFKGVEYGFRVTKAKKNSIEIKNQTMLIGLDSKTDLRQLVKDWMTTETRKYTNNRIKYYGRKLGLDVRDIKITKGKKWGHCTRDRRLVFNWQLIALPKKLADYVILHEISHLSEFSHNNRFNTRLFSLCPDFKEREDALGHILPVQT